MKSLNWFQVARLGRLQRRAIRREGWRYWILYRFGLWLRSEIDGLSGQELRRVVTATDFRDSEFLAKDWTDEVFEGGTTPPCTTLPPATEIPPPLGAGVWTQNERCGGEGEGGGVLPPIIGGAGDGSGGVVDEDPDGGGTGGDTSLPFELEFYPVSATGSAMPAPDGGACWMTPPGTCRFHQGIVVNTAKMEKFRAVYFWFSTSGVDLSGPNTTPYYFPEHSIGKVAGVAPVLYPLSGFAGTSIARSIKYPFAFTPGMTVTGRIEGITLSGQRHIYQQTYTFPDWCYGYEPPVGGELV